MHLKEIHSVLKDNDLLGSEADIYKKTIAGMTHLLNSYIDIKVKELMPDSASEEGLKRWANLIGVSVEGKKLRT